MERGIGPKSVKDHFRQIFLKGQRGERGNPIADEETLVILLEQEGFSFTFSYPENPIPDKPSLFVSNHYIRPYPARGIANISTSQEIIVTSSAIGVAAREFTKRGHKWVMKANVNEGFLGLKCLDRQKQIAFLKCYGFIGVGQEGTGPTFKKIKEALETGQNVGIYPEGSAEKLNSKEGIRYLIRPDVLRHFHRSFPTLLGYLARSQTDFQIVPVSVHSKGKKYKVVFENPIPLLNSGKDVSAAIMATIGSKLPPKLHGPYAHEIKEHLGQVPTGQQPASDQKQ